MSGKHRRPILFACVSCERVVTRHNASRIERLVDKLDLKVRRRVAGALIMIAPHERER